MFLVTEFSAGRPANSEVFQLLGRQTTGISLLGHDDVHKMVKFIHRNPKLEFRNPKQNQNPNFQ